MVFNLLNYGPITQTKAGFREPALNTALPTMKKVGNQINLLILWAKFN